MTTLGFDTSGPWCAAALLAPGEPIVRVEDMARGQAERLIPLLEDVLAQGGLGWRDVTALAVCTGPGNFTGIRIGVSAARGLALGLGVPAIGISTFEAAGAMLRGQRMVKVPAQRGNAYLADAAAPEMARLVTWAEAEEAADAFDFTVGERTLSLARLAALRSGETHVPPTPLYIRPPDAAPARDDGLRLR